MNGRKTKTHYSINTNNNFDIKDILICTGEYSEEENLFYITVTKPGANIYQYTIKSTEKGYLRLWNVFINEGTLKEHQQRFLRGKQEKEKTFIKAQFFDKKPFLFIVGTLENVFYIIDSFQVIHELNVNYSFENIYDLNIQ